MNQPGSVWYGRACVWLGCALLLLMAFTGGQVGLVSVIAVASVAVGIVLLLYAVPWRGSKARLDSSREDSGV